MVFPPGVVCGGRVCTQLCQIRLVRGAATRGETAGTTGFWQSSSRCVLPRWSVRAIGRRRMWRGLSARCGCTKIPERIDTRTIWLRGLRFRCNIQYDALRPQQNCFNHSVPGGIHSSIHSGPGGGGRYRHRGLGRQRRGRTTLAFGAGPTLACHLHSGGPAIASAS